MHKVFSDWKCELCMKDYFALMFCWMCMFVQCTLKAALTAHDDCVLVCGIYGVLFESIVNCGMMLVQKLHQEYK